ncbi:MAG TPA: DUF2182 domain-containing protein [Solirubrobacteraceae bacterium]|nr:DUF2182 domain-containing protein [Solirubrobacteraceae bacterium]
MASLFALGVMSLIWMALVTALIALEKTVTRGGKAPVYATALILLVLGVVLLASPDTVPGITIPGGTPDATRCRCAERHRVACRRRTSRQATRGGSSSGPSVPSASHEQR